MAGKTVVDKIQLGDAGNASFNFLISTLNDGTMKLQRGNDGGALTDVLSIDVNGKITSAYDIAAGQLGLTANGYAKLANGLILQWGTSPASGTSRSVVFPIAFLSAIVFSGIGECTEATANYLFGQITTSSLSGFDLAMYGANAGVAPSGANFPCKWFALGY